jgi:hypothetical protein
MDRTHMDVNCYRCKCWPCVCDDGVTLLNADVFDALCQLPDNSIQCVLRDDGTLFVNLGDSYNSHSPGPKTQNGFPANRTKRQLAVSGAARVEAVDAGNLLNIPHRVAQALQADGWIWRQTIVWAKKSPMPESVSGWRWVRCRVKVGVQHYDGTGEPQRIPTGWNTADGTHNDRDGHHNHGGQTNSARVVWSDCPGCPKCEAHGGYILRRGSGRCTTGHEYLFLFTKTNRYFWDSQASAEKAVGADPGNRDHKFASEYAVGSSGLSHRVAGLAAIGSTQQRNMRSVWTLSSEPTSERHFATFPSELVRRCLSAGTSAVGCCPTCGAPWAPVISTERVRTRPALANKIWKHADGDHVGQRSDDCPNLDPERHIAVIQVHGYRQTCQCPPHKAVGQVVLDPFAGIGTTGQTAVKLGHRFVGIDLNVKYLDVAARRIFEPPRWWLRMQKPKSGGKKKRPSATERMLF